MTKEPALTPIAPATRGDEYKQLLDQAKKLEHLTIWFMISVVILMYLVAGNSQSMKTALLEDILSIIPPTAFLLGTRIAAKKPTPWFCFGFHRASLIAYLAASLALLALGTFAAIDSSLTLIQAHRPTLGSLVIGEQVIWQGWVMLIVIAYSAIPPVFLGRKKEKLARKLDDSTLMADAATNKADWLTGAAAAAGVIGVGLGLWWSDAVMALLISLDIVRDGTVYLRNALGALMDRAPSSIEDPDTPHQIIRKVRDFLSESDDIEVHELRIRSMGRYFTGHAVVSRNSANLTTQLNEEFPELEAFTISTHHTRG